MNGESSEGAIISRNRATMWINGLGYFTLGKPTTFDTTCSRGAHLASRRPLSGYVPECYFRLVARLDPAGIGLPDPLVEWRGSLDQRVHLLPNISSHLAI